MEWVWRAWHTLSADRVTTVRGFAAPLGVMRIVSEPGRIPWTVVHAWCLAEGLSQDEEVFLMHLLSEMDEVHHEWWAARQAQ